MIIRKNYTALHCQDSITDLLHRALNEGHREMVINTEAGCFTGEVLKIGDSLTWMQIETGRSLVESNQAIYIHQYISNQSIIGFSIEGGARKGVE